MDIFFNLLSMTGHWYYCGSGFATINGKLFWEENQERWTNPNSTLYASYEHAVIRTEYVFCVCDARDFWCACVMQRYIQVVLYTILCCNWTTDLLIITWCWRGEGDSLVCPKWVYVPSRVSFLRSWVLKQDVRSPISLLILLYGRFRKWSCYLGICYHPLRQIIPLTHKLKLPVIYESFAIIPVFSRGSIKHKR